MKEPSMSTEGSVKWKNTTSTNVVGLTVRVLKNDAVLRKRFSELRLRRDLFRKSEGFFRKSEGFFQESGGFFRRRGRLLPKKRKASRADAEGSEFRSDQYLRS